MKFSDLTKAIHVVRNDSLGPSDTESSSPVTAHTASEVTGRPGPVYLEPRPYLTASHRLCSQQVSAADLLLLEQLHSGPKGLALRTWLRPSFP